MNVRAVLMLLISLVLAGAAAVAANRWMAERVQTTSTDPNLTGVVAASVEIPFGTKIDETMLKIVELPPKALPEQAFLEIEDVVGRVAAFALFKDEILLDGRVVEHLGGSALSAVVPEGMRAVTVRVNDVAGVAGFLLPGNRVDLIAIRRERGAPETRTLLENLKVLAVDQTTSPEKNEPVIVRAVTVEATPEQAEQIVKATQAGTVQFTLRNPLDGTRRTPEETAETDDAPPPPTADPPRSIRDERREMVVIIRGTNVSEAQFRSEQTQVVNVDYAR